METSRRVFRGWATGTAAGEWNCNAQENEIMRAHKHEMSEMVNPEQILIAKLGARTYLI